MDVIFHKHNMDLKNFHGIFCQLLVNRHKSYQAYCLRLYHNNPPIADLNN